MQLKDIKVGDEFVLLKNSPSPFSTGKKDQSIFCSLNDGFRVEFDVGGSSQGTLIGIHDDFCNHIMPVINPVTIPASVNTTNLVLDKINLVSLNINVWTGKKAMTASDLAANGIDVSKLPPNTLANLGSKRIVSPEMIAPFNVLKRTAAKACAKFGVRFGSCGYAVPEERMAELCDKLRQLQTQFREMTAEFVDEYDQAVAEWVAGNPPEWAPIIRASADTKEHVAQSLSFKFSAMKVVSPDGLGEGLDEEVGSLYGQLCSEIRQMAKIAYETSFQGKTEVTKRAVRPVEAIREKLKGMAFLDPSIDVTVGQIDDVLCLLNTKGSIDGKELNLLSGLVGNQLMHMGLKKPVVEEIEEPEPEVEPPQPEPVAPTQALESLEWDF